MRMWLAILACVGLCIMPGVSLAQTGFENSPEIGAGTFDASGNQRLDSYTGETGLVACTGLDCDFCALMETANNVINLFFEILIIVAVVTVVIVGIRLVVSQGNPAALQQAKESLASVIIGLVIILAAWLIVDTVFKMLVTSNQFGPWNEFDSQDCGSIRNQDGSLLGPRGNGGESAAPAPATPAPGGAGCTSGNECNPDV